MYTFSSGIMGIGLGAPFHDLCCDLTFCDVARMPVNCYMMGPIRPLGRPRTQMI